MTARMFSATIADLEPMRYDDGERVRRHDRASLRRLAYDLDGVRVIDGHRGRVVGRVDIAWVEADGSVAAILELEDAGIAAVAKGKRKISLAYDAHLDRADSSGVARIRRVTPTAVALVRRARCRRAAIRLDLGPVERTDADDTDVLARLASPCRIAPGDDSSSCPIGSAGNDGTLDVGDLTATPAGRAIYARALAARYAAEANGASVDEALAVYHQIIDPAIEDMNERATPAEETMSKKDCNCDVDAWDPTAATPHADVDDNEEQRAADAMRQRSIAEHRGDDEVDPNDLAARHAPDEDKAAREAFAKRGAYNQGSSRGRTREQALAAMARDRERAPAGATQEAGRSDAANANPRMVDAVGRESVYDQIKNGRGVVVNLALPKIEEI